MSRTALTPVKSVSPYGAGPGAGQAETAADATNFNSFVNDGRTMLIIRNKDAGATHTVKFKAENGTQVGTTWTIPKSSSIIAGPFPVLQQFGPIVNVDGNSAELTFTAVSKPFAADATR